MNPEPLSRHDAGADASVSVTDFTVSVIVPAYNCEQFIEECLDSILKQSLAGHNSVHVEISIYDDASTDSTYGLIQDWLRHRAPEASEPDKGRTNVEEGNTSSVSYLLTSSSDTRAMFSAKLSRNSGPKPRGVGFARNRCIDQSTGNYLCFCDADDVMMPKRIAAQLKCAQGNPTALIGTNFIRLPLNSMETLTTWANSLSPAQLHTQIFTSFGPTLVMPTWFCSRPVYDTVGGFCEDGYGVPEDLILFYKHLSCGGSLIRVDSEGPLMIYRHHPAATTFSVSTDTIWNLRLERLEAEVLSESKWSTFTIWNAGKLGRKLFRSLSPENQAKVGAFCDVDLKKITQGYYQPFPMKCKIPIVSFRDASPPFVICVKTELTFAPGPGASTSYRNHKPENSAPSHSPASSSSPPMTNTSTPKLSFLENLESLHLTEGVDYFYFN